jgi:REase_DpnII-MboI
MIIEAAETPEEPQSQSFIGAQISALEQRITEAIKEGGLDGLLAHYILADKPVTVVWDTSLNDEIRRSESAESPLDTTALAGLGFSSANLTGVNTLIERSALRDGLRRLANRDPLRDKLGFPYHPAQLVGICLAAVAVRAEQPESAIWLREVLTSPTHRPPDGFLHLLKFYCLALLEDKPARTIDAGALTDAVELATARWITASGHGEPAHADAARLLEQRTLQAVLRTDPTRLSAPRCALLLHAALDIVNTSVDQVVLGRSHVSLVLRRFEAAMRRWRWDDDSLQKPIRWPITAEREVQDILWIVLRSVFDDVKDEETLPKVGHHSYRADFGLPRIKVLVEAKFVRKLAEFEKIEREIMEDAVGYLNQTDLYKEIVVFIYDDSSSVEHHDLTRSALLGVPGISEVIIVSRPGILATATPRPVRRPRKSAAAPRSRTT